LLRDLIIGLRGHQATYDHSRFFPRRKAIPNVRDDPTRLLKTA